MTELDHCNITEEKTLYIIQTMKFRPISVCFRAAAGRLCCCRALQQTAGSADLLLLFAAANSLPKPVYSAVRLLLQSSAMADRYD